MYNCFTILPIPHCSKHCNSTHHLSTVISFTITFVSLKFIRGSVLSLCQTLLSEWTSVVMIRISLDRFSKISNYKWLKLCRGRTVLQLILTADQPNVDLLFFKPHGGTCIHRHAHTPSLTTLYHFKPVIIMGLIWNRSSVLTFIYHCCTWNLKQVKVLIESCLFTHGSSMIPKSYNRAPPHPNPVLHMTLTVTPLVCAL